MIGAVDIGGTKIAVGLVDEGGRVHGRCEQPTRSALGLADGARRIVAMLRESAAAAGAPIDGVGVGSSGPIDPMTGVYGVVDNLASWSGGDLLSPLRSALGVAIVVENDADAAALGEATWGAGRGHRRMLYVTISTGIGGGFILDGELYRGLRGAHPEVGHHMLEASGPRCSCGGRGCWEILASGPAMVAWARANVDPFARPGRAPGKSAERAPPDGLHRNVDEPGVLPVDLTAQEICRRAEVGEAWARRVVEREAFYLGIGLANLIVMFAPDVVVLGGGVMRSAHLFLDEARRVMRSHCTLVPSEGVVIALAALGADAGLAGAARAFQLRTRR